MHHAEGKTVKTAVKTVLIVCAAAVCALRFVSFRYEASLSPGVRHAMLTASVIGAVLCALFAVLLAVLEKKEKNGT